MQNLINLHKWSFDNVTGSSSKVEYLCPKGNSDISSLTFFLRNMMMIFNYLHDDEQQVLMSSFF